jgi:hypothetical protein
MPSLSKPLTQLEETCAGNEWGLALPEFLGDSCDIFLCFAGF